MLLYKLGEYGKGGRKMRSPFLLINTKTKRGEIMATIKQIIAEQTGAGSRASQYKKSAKASAKVFMAAGFTPR